MSKIIRIVLVTSPSEECSLKIARSVVSKHLAACVNILPQVKSIYTWEGKVEESAEELLVIKTQEKNISKLKEEILTLHPYDTPEFVVMEVDQIEEKYENWLLSVT